MRSPNVSGNAADASAPVRRQGVSAVRKTMSAVPRASREPTPTEPFHCFREVGDGVDQ